ncbi:MAG: glycosyltransferase, partial [Lachnospiraceae bacterium]|nr:glycosyltransferase [Lachnospiraceae bacterium]
AGCRMDKLIHFSGYSNDMTTIFRGASCNRTIYVHNDMEKEIRERRLIRTEVLARAYQEYDSVAVVTEDIKGCAERIAKKLPLRVEKTAEISVAKNIINYRRVLDLAEQEISFDARTKSNVSTERLQEILASKATKFINIGRFSAEKGHARLLDAFDKIHKENPETYLIIIGGRGELYEETLKKAQALDSYDHIVIILFMPNPFAVLKQCDYFIFSSFYEGFGLVLAEADILGVRCVSTDIPGPRLFMKKYGGTLVEDSEQGVYEGMKLCLDGKVTDTLSVNYEEYNKEAVAEFERIAAME